MMPSDSPTTAGTADGKGVATAPVGLLAVALAQAAGMAPEDADSDMQAMQTDQCMPQWVTVVA